jgi:uncharacterized protein YdhG (YjbR/CyaY superfamily)
MQSHAKDVTTYVREAPEARRACLERLRSLCLETLAGYDEVMEYGMPAYTKDGKVEVAFASQKHYLSLYILKPDVVRANAELLRGLNVGKGCIRFSRPEAVDFAVVARLLADTVASDGLAC